MTTVTLRPSADGIRTEWTRLNNGISHYQHVNEASPDDDTAFVFATAGTEVDLFDLPDSVPSGAASISVEIFVRAKSAGAPSEQYAIVCYLSGNYAFSVDKFVSGAAWTNQSAVFATAPDGGTWTKAKTDSMQIGVYADAVPTNSIDVTQVYAVVTYTVPFAATGSPTLPHLTATAAAKQSQKATGAPNLPHMTAVGSGLMKPKGTVTATLPHLTVMGLGGQGRNVGFVVVTLPHLTALASGYEKPVGTIDVHLPHLTALATGVMKPKATGTPTLPHLTATATGLFKFTATGSPHLPHLTATATGLKGAAVGHAAPTLAHLVATVAGKQRQTSTGAGVLGHLRAAATGGVPERGAAAATLPHLTSTSNGIFHFRANFAPNAGGRVYS